MAKDRNDFNSLPDRASRARSAINNLSSAFEDLSRNGTLTHRSLTATASALGAIPHPAAQVASLGLQIASGFMRASEAAAKLREQQLAEELKRIEESAEAARDRVEAFRDSMLSGASIAEARLIQQIADISAGYVKAEKATTERIEVLKKERETVDASIGSYKSINEVLSEYTQSVDRAGEIDEEMAFLQRDLAFHLVDSNEKIAKLKAALDAFRPSVKKASDGTKEFKDELSRLKGNEIKWEAYTPTPGQVARVFEFKDAVRQTGEMVAFSFGSLGAASFDQYATAMERVIDGHNAFGKGAGRSYQNATAEILKALGREAAARAVMHLAMAAAGTTAWGIAAYGLPSDNLKAAALFGSVAVLAGAGGAALSVKAPSSGSGGRGGSSDETGGPRISVNAVFLGAPDDATLGEFADRLKKYLARSGS